MKKICGVSFSGNGDENKIELSVTTKAEVAALCKEVYRQGADLQSLWWEVRWDYVKKRWRMFYYQGK